MRHSSFLAPALLAAAAMLTMTGCFKHGARGDYAMAPEMRPLEVPPDLDAPNTAGAAQVPALASVVRAPQAAQVAAPAQGGFAVSGERDAVFDKLGQALAAIDGVTVTSSAKVLGSYDLTYEGSNFLVRVTTTDAGSYVSAIDSRGLPATDAAVVKLMDALKARLGG